MKRTVDLAIVGAGFGGSLMAMVAHQLGLSVILMEQGRHPRMAIGESTTPLSNLLLEQLSARYNLPRLAPLARWGPWQRAYPQINCGLKRGFSFFHHNLEYPAVPASHHGDQLLVAASPHDEIADTHWYRADVDQFLALEAQDLGVAYHDEACLKILNLAKDGTTFAVSAHDEEFEVHARLVIDATGPRGFFHHALQLGELPFPDLPARQSLYSHFTDVTRTPLSHETTPYPVDDAAVHHVFEGGWIWVLRFGNGITSAGVAATGALASQFALSEGAPAWSRLVERIPALQSQFAQASACQPFRHLPSTSFRSDTIVGSRWAMLPSAAGFVDPLFSTGFSLTLLGIERLARMIAADPDLANLEQPLQSYAQQTDADLLAAGHLIGAMYATMGNFEAFTAMSLLYFAAVSYAESAHRLGKPELATGFLLHDHPQFGPAARMLLHRAHKLGGTDTTKAFAEDVLRHIEPFNLGRFGDPARKNWYPVIAEDLLAARHKLGVSREQVLAMLDTAGFYSA